MYGKQGKEVLVGAIPPVFELELGSPGVLFLLPACNIIICICIFESLTPDVPCYTWSWRVSSGNVHN